MGAATSWCLEEGVADEDAPRCGMALAEQLEVVRAERGLGVEATSSSLEALAAAVAAAEGAASPANAHYAVWEAGRQWLSEEQQTTVAGDEIVAVNTRNSLPLCVCVCV